MPKRLSEILFVVILLSVAGYYNYYEIAFKRPQSTHKWRQSDCASLALNYYQGGMNFAQPKTHNLTSDNGTTGFNATSEVPILYYSVALLYKVFGYHDYVYRIFNTLLFFLGMFYLFKLFELFLQKPIWSILLAILFFTSPLLVYYGNNFLSNSTALAFSIVGWYYFFWFTKTKHTKWLWVSMFIFLIAASLKITALFSVFAVIGIFLLEWVGVKIGSEKHSVFSKKLLFLILSIIVLVVPIWWILYAHEYNKAHDTTYFSTTIFPIWDLDSSTIYGVLENVKDLWQPHYFHLSILVLLPLLFLIWIFQFKKANKIIWWATVIILFEIIFYIALQFWTFADHDYYTINLYILPILLLIGISDWIKKNHPNWLDSKIALFSFTLFIGFNIQYTHTKTHERYNSWMNDYEQTKALYTITPALRRLGITASDKIISIPDMSHASLYLMNQPGWTEYTDEHFNRGKKTRYNQDRNGILKSIRNGAKHLIINGIEQLYQKPYLQEFATHWIGNYDGVLIFDLTKTEKNFTLKKKIIKTIYFCGAENLTASGESFTSNNCVFENGSTQTSEDAFSGNYAVKLDAKNPYGMTLKLNNLVEGESFKITFWRKANVKSHSTLIATSDPNYFNHSEIEIIETNPNGWTKYESEFMIPWNITQQELKIFLYNPDPEPAYFDDLQVIRYESYLR